MRIKELIEKLNSIVPENTQESWDNCGIQVGDVNREVKGIIVSLDATDEIIDAAIELNANLIICHHPLIFKPLKNLEFFDSDSRKISKLIKNDIAVYAMHTNFDIADGGVNSVLAERIGLKVLGNIEELENGGIGLYGEVPIQKASEFSQTIKESLDLLNIIAYGDLNKEVQKVGVLGGAGGSSVKNAFDLGLDLFITSDIKYHEALYAIDNGLLLFDIGHYGSENPSIDALEKIVKEFADVEVYRFYSSCKYSRFVI